MKKQVDLRSLFLVTFKDGKETIIKSERSLSELEDDVKNYDYVLFGKEVVHSCDVDKIVSVVK